jgi:hypothetical protein
MAGLEITKEFQVDRLLSISNANGFQMTACPILMEDPVLLQDQTVLNEGSLNVKDIRIMI